MRVIRGLKRTQFIPPPLLSYPSASCVGPPGTLDGWNHKCLLSIVYLLYLPL